MEKETAHQEIALTHPLEELARNKGTPLIDHENVTFVWLGKQAPRLAADFTDWERGAPVSMKRVATGVWSYQLKLPQDAYIEYAFLTGENERLPDPLNHRTTPNGIGDTNHYFYMPNGQPTDLARRKRNAPKGRLSTHLLTAPYLAGNGRRKIALYQPPTSEPAPLVVVWDGPDYRQRARLPIIVDNLIFQNRIQPIALAMVPNGGSTRMLEYGCSEVTLLFLQEQVLPLAKKCLNLIQIDQQPGAFGVLGASMGGLMALFTSLRLPQIFGKALSQSGAFSLKPFGSDPFDTVVFDLARQADWRGKRFWLDAGLFDFQYLLTANRRMHSVLAENGCQHQYLEHAAGHNYPTWRNQVWRGLGYLFPPERFS
jgi:enterochelin esterase family protein